MNLPVHVHIKDFRAASKTVDALTLGPTGFHPAERPSTRLFILDPAER